MSETYTGGTVKLSCPSNYAENRRGSEVTLSFALPEGTTCEQADEATRRVRLLALKHVLAGQSGDVSDVGSLSLAPVPEKTAEPPKRTRKPASEITIGATDASAAASTEKPAAGSEAPPFGAATQAEPQPAQPASVTNGSAPAFSLPVSPPSSTGTAGNSAPPFATTAAAGPVGSVPPSVPQPVEQAASSSLEGEITDATLQKHVAHEMVRLAGIVGAQAGSLVTQVTRQFTSDPAKSFRAIPQEQRQTFLDMLAAQPV